MAAYLIVGMPGAGKTTLTRELQQRGLIAIDADWDTELSKSRHSETGEMKREITPEEAATGKFEWAWDPERITEILVEHASDDWFLLGNAVNAREFYTRFNKVFALIVPNGTLTKRIRQRGSGYGTNPAELAHLQKINPGIPKLEIAAGAIIIDANHSTSRVADEVLQRVP